MAYLAFDELGSLHPETAARPYTGSHAGENRLSALEWAVVVLARGDRLSTLRQPGRLATALGNLFGRGTNPRLADPRLEALRRIAVLAWHDRVAVPAREIGEFLAAGFTAGQYDTMLASIRAASLDGTRHA